MADKKERIKELVSELKRHSILYDKSMPEISDSSYDMLYRELLVLETETGFVLPDSPTQHVGYQVPPAEKFRAVTHRKKLLSLDNAFNADEVREYYARLKKLSGVDKDIRLLCDYKLDGLTLSALYINGILEEAGIRGDGMTGESVLHNAMVIPTIPKRLTGNRIPSLIEVRGEAMMPLAEFNRLNKEREEEGEELYVNTRSAAAGSMRLKDPDRAKKRGLIFCPHGVGGTSEEFQFDTLIEVTEWFKEAGFEVRLHPKEAKDVEEAIRIIAEIEAERPHLDMEIDGVVLKTVEIALHDVIGQTNKAPRHSIAFKFEEEKASTVIEDVIVQVGKSGQLSPVAKLTPVFCGGAHISRATLHSFVDLAKKGVRKGATAIVCRKGEVVPAVVEIVKREGETLGPPITAPTHCPVCGSAVVKYDDEVAVFCPNFNCSAQVVRRLIHWGSRDALDISGLGGKTVIALHDAGLIRHFTDLYRLRKEDILALPGFADKSAQNLIDAIAESKNTTLARFMYALGLPNFGRTATHLVAGTFERIEDLYHVTQASLIAIDQIGQEISRIVADFFRTEENISAMEDMKTMGLNLSNPDYVAAKGTVNGMLSGQTFCITGIHTVPRNDIEEQIKKAGGKVTDSVSKKTTYLIAGEKAGSKLAKTKTCGVRIVTYDEFLTEVLVAQEISESALVESIPLF